MKTPQEIAAQLVEDSYGEYGFLGDQPFADMIAKALAAAREEGRREGIEQAAELAANATHQHVCKSTMECCATDGGHAKLAHAIRGLASDTEAREPGCRCHQEAGDSPCPVHGEEELSENDRALASQPKPDPAVTCEGCKRGLPTNDNPTTGLWHHKVFSNGNWAAWHSPCTAADAGKETK